MCHFVLHLWRCTIATFLSSLKFHLIYSIKVISKRKHYIGEDNWVILKETHIY